MCTETEMYCTLCYWILQLQDRDFMLLQICKKLKCTVLYVIGELRFTVLDCCYLKNLQKLKCTVL
jgi:hypothetical protein